MRILARHHLILRRCAAAAAAATPLRSRPPPLPLRARRAAMSGAAGGEGASPAAAVAKAAPEVDALALFTGPGADHLRGQSCSVHGDTPAVPEAELARLLAALPAWRLAPDGASLSRAFVARNFLAALGFFEGVGAVAEREGHHPDLHLTDFRRVEVVVATHEGGQRVTMADLVLAAKIDALPADYSPKWLREQRAEAAQRGA